MNQSSVIFGGGSLSNSLFYFALYRLKVPPRLVCATTSHTPRADDADMFRTTSERRFALRVVTLPQKCVTLTGP